MAKISPVSIKYMIYANFTAEGALEKPDIIGAIFGQTEGLLGSDLEMRELQKEGKIGRIEVDLERNDRRTTGTIRVPTALDQSETTLIAAAIETIERIGPCDSQIEIEKIEDVRGSKRDYIIERAKKLMYQLHGSTSSREISKEIKDSAKMSDINEYGESKLPCGDISENEVIVVEGRADVLNLLRNGIKNVIGMNGTKMPLEIKQLGEEKELTLFIDGDRGGKLIAQNVVDNAKINYIAVAPEGKEVEELTGKEILMNLRKKVPARDFFSRGRSFTDRETSSAQKEAKDENHFELTKKDEDKLRQISDRNKGDAVLLDRNFEEVKRVPARSLGSYLRRSGRGPFAIIVDGNVTAPLIETAEDMNVRVIVAKNFSANSNKIKMLSL